MDVRLKDVGGRAASGTSGREVVGRRLEQAAEEVLYAARGQEAHSRPAKAGIHLPAAHLASGQAGWFIKYIPAQAGMTIH